MAIGFLQNFVLFQNKVHELASKLQSKAQPSPPDIFLNFWSVYTCTYLVEP